MIIDTHIHENKYSFDSFIDFKECIHKAKTIGLDGLCITNHDNNDMINDIGNSTLIDNTLIIVGAEILTFEGDILVFGVRDIPKHKVSAKELLTYVNEKGGAAVAAHPFRNNNRGIGNNMKELSHLLVGVESFNGSTLPNHNLQSYKLSAELNLPSLGASDAHIIDKVGTFATNFNYKIRDHRDFIEALKSGNFNPVVKEGNMFKDIKCYYEKHINTLLDCV